MKQLDVIRLGRALASARAERGMTTRDLEGATGVSKATISRAERAHPDGTRSAASIVVLCDFFGMDPRTFLTGVFHENTPVRQDAIGGTGQGVRS